MSVGSNPESEWKVAIPIKSPDPAAWRGFYQPRAKRGRERKSPMLRIAIGGSVARPSSRCCSDPYFKKSDSAPCRRPFTEATKGRKRPDYASGPQVLPTTSAPPKGTSSKHLEKAI